MKNILIIIAFLITVFPGKAQQLSIEQLWGKGFESAQQRQKATQVSIQEEQLNVRRSERFPIIYGDVNLQRNLIIPTTPVPAIAFDPNAQEGAIIPLKFSTKWNAKAGLQLEWDLFNPTQRQQRAEDELHLQRARIESQQDYTDWKKNATLAYASVVLATQQYQSSLQDSAIYAEILTTTALRYESGRISSEENRLAQQELERKIITMYQAWQVLQESNAELANYVLTDSIRFLSSDIKEIQRLVGNGSDSSYTQQLIEIDRKVAEVQLKGIKRQLLPTLSLNGYLGSQFFSNDFNMVDKDSWYGHSFANVALKIPITAYFSNGASIRKAGLQEKIYRLQLEEEISKENNDRLKKNAKVQFFQKQRIGLQKILELAERNKNEKRSAYDAGRILISDLNKAYSEFLKAQQDVLQAEYDLLDAQLL